MKESLKRQYLKIVSDKLSDYLILHDLDIYEFQYNAHKYHYFDSISRAELNDILADNYRGNENLVALARLSEALDNLMHEEEDKLWK